ncbi:helix-turn-helix domain-containing protein [Agrobacterium fabrum]|uniref:helix-turn-helix domain-containing protein n=1 Tax=Agrobacterium fabrum TaxID=1176649 RepID=UPI001FED6D4D|nr:helix-turn-helix domain-containing protein [Agrobacterium fabrum]
MSRSTFHAHFKAVTNMSPLEFRTQLRLQEARRLMLSEGLDAATAGSRSAMRVRPSFRENMAGFSACRPPSMRMLCANRPSSGLNPWHQ